MVHGLGSYNPVCSGLVGTQRKGKQPKYRQSMYVICGGGHTLQLTVYLYRDQNPEDNVQNP